MYAINTKGRVYKVENNPDMEFLDLRAEGLPMYYEKRMDATYVRDTLEDEVQPNIWIIGWKPQLLSPMSRRNLETLCDNVSKRMSSYFGRT